MEHRTTAELKGFSEVIHPHKLSKKELLERWVLALDKRKGTRLCTLRETEYKPVEEQSALRQENSPLTVAFEDPVLRSAGLTNDTFGEVARFFGLSHWQHHHVGCGRHSALPELRDVCLRICDRRGAFGRNCFALKGDLNQTLKPRRDAAVPT